MNYPLLISHREYYQQKAMQDLIDAVINKDPQAIAQVPYVIYRAKKLKRVRK